MSNFDIESDMYIQLQTILTDKQTANLLYTRNCMSKTTSYIRALNIDLAKQIAIKYKVDALRNIPGAIEYLSY